MTLSVQEKRAIVGLNLTINNLTKVCAKLGNSLEKSAKEFNKFLKKY